MIQGSPGASEPPDSRPGRDRKCSSESLAFRVRTADHRVRIQVAAARLIAGLKDQIITEPSAAGRCGRPGAAGMVTPSRWPGDLLCHRDGTIIP